MQEMRFSQYYITKIFYVGLIRNSNPMNKAYIYYTQSTDSMGKTRTDTRFHVGGVFLNVNV